MILTGWKTRILAMVLMFLGTIQATDLATIVPAAYTGIAMAVIGGLVYVLRQLTSTPAGTQPMA